MKKHLLPLVFALFSVVCAFAQQPVNAPQKFNANVIFNDSTYNNPTKVPVTTFEDTVRITRGAGNGKVLASDANGNAYWTNVVLVDTFSGTPVFPSGIKTDTVFNTDFNGTGYVMQLVNDTTGLFKPMVFSNGLTKTGDTIKIQGELTEPTTIVTGANAFQVITDTSLFGYFVFDSTIGVAFGHGNLGVNILSDSIFLFRANSQSSITIDSASGTVIRGNLAYKGGSPGAGKVLTSDAGGNATWAASSTTSLDSTTIYALTPTAGTMYYCNDCSGNGITGRIVAFIGAAWRRLTFED